MTDPEADERRRLRLLRTVVDLTTNVLAQGRMTRPEAEALVAATRRRALELFPDKDSTYDLILAPRFARLMDEFAGPPAEQRAALPQALTRRPPRFPVEYADRHPRSGLDFSGEGVFLSVDSPEFTQATYDKVADAYDDLWSRNVREPNARLTRALDLKRGERVADLACGTGLFTVAMAQAVAPGEVVGVDVSEGMLAAAQKRAGAQGLSLSLDQDKIEDFVAAGAARELRRGVAALRAGLHRLGPRAPAHRRHGPPGGPRGRAHQHHRQRAAVLQAVRPVPRVVRRGLEAVQALPEVLRRGVEDLLAAARHLRGRQVHLGPRQRGDGGGAAGPGRPSVPTDTWTDRIRLWFKSGEEAVAWMEESGYATHPTLQHVSPDTLRFLETLFAEGLEGFREPQGIPLDFVIAGVVARK